MRLMVTVKESPSIATGAVNPSAGGSASAEFLSHCLQFAGSGEIYGYCVLDLETRFLAQVLNLVYQLTRQSLAAQLVADHGADTDGAVSLGFD